MIKAILWMVIPVFFVFRFTSIIVAGIMFISMLVQLTIALAKGWFKVPIKRTIALGGSNIILSYALVGITLSIYRYKSVYP